MSQFKILKNSAERSVPQTEAVDVRQVQNSAGGYSFKLSPMQHLRRFLILGTEGGTYYASQAQHTNSNIELVRAIIASNPKDAIEEIVNISKSGRAPKNDQALFALSVAMTHSDESVRRMAFDALPDVARTGTHVLHLASYLKGQRTFGRGVQRAFESWMKKQGSKGLALQMSKYKQRDGMSMRDLLRMVRPRPINEEYNAVYNWVISKGWDDQQLESMKAYIDSADKSGNVSHLIYLQGVEEVSRAKNAKECAQLISKYGLQREVVPTEFLTSAEVLEALLPNMGLEALIRNLGNLSKAGVLTKMSTVSKEVVNRITDQDALRKARVHPIKILAAYLTYKSGKGMRGSGSWEPVQSVVDALDQAFYKAFGNVEPTGKNTLLALDVSGSMGWTDINGIPGLTPKMGSAAMALVTLNVEPNVEILGFSDKLVNIPIGKRDSIESAINKIEKIPMGGTNCSLPMIYAESEKLAVDTFVVYTDSETYAGNIHPHKALQKYRKSSGVKDSKLCVVGMVSNGFTIADPTDTGMIDVVGFDTSTPEIISQFSAGLL